MRSNFATEAFSRLRLFATDVVQSNDFGIKKLNIKSVGEEMKLNFLVRESKIGKDGTSPIELSVIIEGVRKIISLDSTK